MQGRPSLVNLLNDFNDFLTVDKCLADKTVAGHVRQIKRFVKWIGQDSEVTRNKVRNYLKRYRDRPADTYANVLKSLRVFFRDFVNRADLVRTFKFPAKRQRRIINVPSKQELRTFFNELEKPLAKTMFLMYASTGLRRSEILELKRKNVNPKLRMIIPENNGSRTKRAYITFYNEEAAKLPKEIIPENPEARVFPVSKDYFHDRYMKNRAETEVKLTLQVLREWFSCEMGRLGVPDRYIDAFCGRVPRSVLAKHYTDYRLEKLKEIYDKAGLRVLS